MLQECASCASYCESLPLAVSTAPRRLYTGRLSQMSRALLRKEETPSTQLTYFLSLPCDKTGRHNGSAEEGEERKKMKRIPTRPRQKLIETRKEKKTLCELCGRTLHEIFLNKNRLRKSPADRAMATRADSSRLPRGHAQYLAQTRVRCRARSPAPCRTSAPFHCREWSAEVRRPALA